MNLPIEIKTTFSQYLLEIRKSSPNTVKNYLSDLRHFFSWANSETSFEKNQKTGFQVNKITPQLLTKYQKHLLTESIAKSTQKRRLATIRVFCQFCLKQGFLAQNPATELDNYSKTSSKDNVINISLAKFEAWLKIQGSSKNTVKNYLADVKSYLKWATLRLR